MQINSGSLLRLCAPAVAVASVGIAATALPSHQDASALTNCTVSAADAQLNSDEQAFLSLINGYRASNGLGALVSSPTLNRAAAWHAADMLTKGYFAHTEPSGRTFSQRLTDCEYPTGGYRAENIATGFASAQAVFDSWRNSPGHNANMLNPSVRAIGIGKAGTYWTTDFGSIVDGVAPATREASTAPATIVATQTRPASQPSQPARQTEPTAILAVPTTTSTARANPPAAAPTGAPTEVTSVGNAPRSQPDRPAEAARTVHLYPGFNYLGPTSSVTAAEFVSCLGDSWTAVWYWAADEVRWRSHFPEGDGPGQVPPQLNSPEGNGIGTIPGGRGVAIYITEEMAAASVPNKPGEGCLD